jgi:hypothetical protein
LKFPGAGKINLSCRALRLSFRKTENDFRLYSKEKIEKGNALTDFRVEDFKDNLKK